MKKNIQFIRLQPMANVENNACGKRGCVITALPYMKSTVKKAA